MTSDAQPPVRVGRGLRRLLRTRLWLQIVIGMVLGVTLGLTLSPEGGALLSADVSKPLIGWIALPGHIFLALIQMIVVALVLTSIVMGIASAGSGADLRRLGLRIAPYFIITTTVAVTIGLSLASWVRPGDYVASDTIQQAMASAKPMTVPVVSQPVSLADRVVALIPAEPLRAVLERAMLQIVVMALCIGVALTSMPSQKAKPILDLLGSVQELSMTIVSWAMAIAPLAVLGLLAQISYQIGIDALLGMSVYVGTVLLGLVLLLGFYVVVVAVFGRQHPVRFMRAIREAQLLAFSTSSSAAVMPLSLKVAQEKLGIQPTTAQFVIPLGATVNMDGTALYQAVAAVFLTQVFGIDLSPGELVLLAATATGASIGAPSAPGVGIVILATLVAELGVPAGGIALIIGVDRILDMSRTALNVTGDLTACAVMDRWLRSSSSETGGGA